jgi:hypothetical protein
MAKPDAYQSKWAFDEGRIGAAALYCSDGRYGEQMDDYLHASCGWPRYDRLALPGGPALLSGSLSVIWEEETLRKFLEFLVRVHGIKKLALIAHEGCAFYSEWLRVPPEGIAKRQLADLQQARQRVMHMLPGLEVHTMFARRQRERVLFYALE